MVSVVLVLMNTYFITQARDMIFSSKIRAARTQAGVIEIALGDDALTTSYVSQIISRLDVSQYTNVIVVDNYGRQLFGSGGTSIPEAVDYHENVALALSGYDISYSSFSNGTFETGAYVPVMHDSVTTGAIFLMEQDAEQGAVLAGLQNTVIRVTYLVVVLSLILIALITLTLMRRVTSIIRGIESVREGEYTYEIRVTGNDELALLSREFNDLTRKLRETENVRRRFVADASHELKTPLASIRLLSDSILSSSNMDVHLAREFVTDIGHEAERLSRTTEKLMKLARLDSDIDDRSKAVDLKNTVKSAVRMLMPVAAETDITISLNLADDCLVFASDDALHSVVYNLIENAVKYNTEGGRIDITLTHTDSTVVLSVADTGIGIPVEDLENIFQRFYRVDKARSRAAGGSGLGLSIVYSTLLRYGGSIEAKRRPGGGTEFVATLPLYEK